MQKKYRILAINPGSTSTKISLFENDENVMTQSITHSEAELHDFQHIQDQEKFRVKVIEKFLNDHDIDLDSLDGIVGRGGLLKPIPGGTYKVNEQMLDEVKSAKYGEHASNLGAIIASDLAKPHNLPVFIVDPVVVDELAPIARFSGLPELPRKSIFHALNQKAAARRAAKEIGKNYTDLNLIVVHLGGGISVGAHEKGRIIDVNNALNGDGPFSPERAGGVPAAQLIDLCYSGKYTIKEIKRRLVGKGGMVAYIGINDMRKVQDLVEAGDVEATRHYEAMAYQVSKHVGQCATVLKGKVDAIVVSGGMAYDPIFTGWIKERTEWIAKAIIYPGEEGMKALALGALRVLSGEEEAKQYE